MLKNTTCMLYMIMQKMTLSKLSMCNHLQMRGHQSIIIITYNIGRFVSDSNLLNSGWPVKMKTHFKRDSPIWLLGKCYHCSQSGESVSEVTR